MKNNLIPYLMRRSMSDKEVSDMLSQVVQILMLVYKDMSSQKTKYLFNQSRIVTRCCKDRGRKQKSQQNVLLDVVFYIVIDISSSHPAVTPQMNFPNNTLPLLCTMTMFWKSCRQHISLPPLTNFKIKHK